MASIPEPGLYREVRPAWSDENLRYLCRHIRSHLFFAHVRSATGTPTTRPNCHPFACGRWLFMHNGLIGNWSRVRRQVEALIPDEFYGSRIGTTDSEAVFLAILGAGADRDPVGATLRTLATLTDIVNADGHDEPLRFTAALADGQNLYAFRYAANDAANTLYYRVDDGDVVLVSEPLDSDRVGLDRGAGEPRAAAPGRPAGRTGALPSRSSWSPRSSGRHSGRGYVVPARRRSKVTSPRSAASVGFGSRALTRVTRDRHL